MSINVTSTAFQHGMTIPKPYTGDGADQSPPLRWSEPPSGTKSIALICDDPDAPRGIWVHWVLFNLPTNTHELEEGVPTTATLPSGAKQGKNDFGNIGYGGLAPPKCKAHRYFFNSKSLRCAPWLRSWLKSVTAFHSSISKSIRMQSGNKQSS